MVIDQKFDYLYRAENGNFVAVVVNADGSTTESEIDIRKTPSQTLITDGQGDSLVYSQNGHLMGIKEYRATGGNAALLKDYHSKKRFAGAVANQLFAVREYYPYLSANYDLRYKSVENVVKQSKITKETITFDGKTYSVSDFLGKYEDNNIKYNHIYDGKYHNFIKYSEKFSAGVEYIVDPITKSVTYKIVTYLNYELIKIIFYK